MKKLHICFILSLIVCACGNDTSQIDPPASNPDDLPDAPANPDDPADPDGPPNPPPVPAELQCDDGLDNNSNGLFDCADPTCLGQIMCPPAQAVDPARKSLALECQGPLADLTDLLKFIPAGSGAANLSGINDLWPSGDEGYLWRYTQKCNDLTGCTAINSYNDAIFAWYALRIDPAGGVHISERDRSEYALVRDVAVTSPEFQVVLGAGFGYDEDEPVLRTVRLTNPTPNKLCVSVASTSVLNASGNITYTMHVGRFTLDEQTHGAPPAPLEVLKCNAELATNAQLAGWFAPGGTILASDNVEAEVEKSRCNALTGCIGDRNSTGNYLFNYLVVINGAVNARLMAGTYFPFVNGKFNATVYGGYAFDQDKLIHIAGSAHSNRCIQAVSAQHEYNPWLFSDLHTDYTTISTF